MNSIPTCKFLKFLTGKSCCIIRCNQFCYSRVTNKVRGTLMVTADEVDGMIETSSYLE